MNEPPNEPPNISRTVWVVTRELMKMQNRIRDQGVNMCTTEAVAIMIAVPIGAAREAGIERAAFDQMITMAWNEWTVGMEKRRS